MSNFLSIPHIGPEEQAEVSKALESGMLTCGKYLEEFTRLLSETVEQDVLICSSGTAALHLGLHALGIGKGDEVIVPNISFISTINAVLYVGATPVICDVGDPAYALSLNPDIVGAHITPRTKAIIVAHLFGGAGHTYRLRNIADNYGIALIEDAAQSIGCKDRGKALGTIGTFGIYSFNGNKIVTASGGGAITSSDIHFMARVKRLIDQAKDPLEPFSHIEMGYNYRLSNIHAAIGYAQLKKLDMFIEKKKAIYEIYKKRLNMILWSQALSSNYWMNVCHLRTASVADVYNHLKTLDIESRPIYMPFHLTDYLAHYARGEYPESEDLYNSLICLPSDIGLDLKKIPVIIDEVEACDGKAYSFNV